MLIQLHSTLIRAATALTLEVDCAIETSVCGSWSLGLLPTSMGSRTVLNLLERSVSLEGALIYDLSLIMVAKYLI